VTPELSIALHVLNWIVTGTGWLIVHRTSVRRARRLEDLDITKELRQRVESLRSRVVDLLCKPGTDGQVQAWIRIEIKSIGSIVEELSSRADRRINLKREWTDFRKAVSKGDWESPTRPALKHTDRRIEEILESSVELTRAARELCDKANS